MCIRFRTHPPMHSEALIWSSRPTCYIFLYITNGADRRAGPWRHGECDRRAPSPRCPPLPCRVLLTDPDTCRTLCHCELEHRKSSAAHLQCEHRLLPLFRSWLLCSYLHLGCWRLFLDRVHLQGNAQPALALRMGIAGDVFCKRLAASRC